MAWGIEFTDEFGQWFDALAEAQQDAVAVKVALLEQLGVLLDHPHSSDVVGARHGHMRELRIQHGGEPYRVLYAFDPRRIAILLIGGNKAGDGRWYDRMIPIADRLYDEHLKSLARETESR